MDQDTVRGRHGHARILEEFRSGKADILLGTKMIAKGLDFEKVTLVGVVSADQGIFFPDFRASEKVFQLLTQAAGRAGRGANSGEVIVQTMDPDHLMFKYLMTHDYLSFYEKEIESRKNLKYPPFSRLILLRIEGAELEQVQKYSIAIKNFLWKANREKFYGVLGPAPSPISRINDIYRYQILVKLEKRNDDKRNYLKQLIKKGILDHSDIKKWPVKIVIDVDPVDIL
jgi:primosomal protein N' (replication factor Y)